MAKKKYETINTEHGTPIMVYPEDQTVLYDDKGDIVYDENGETYPSIDYAVYVHFFCEHIQRIYGGIADGLSLASFAKRWNDDMKGYLMKYTDFVRNVPIYSYQQEMEKKGAHINAFALFALCCFLDAIIREKKVVLLMPTMQDLLEEIGDVSEVTLFNKNGEKITSCHPELLDTINSSLHNPNEKENQYRLYKLENRIDRYTLETLQVEFAFYFSYFFHEYFKIERRNNGLLSTLEQNILSSVLKYFGLSAVEVTESRFRQLKMHFKDLFNNVNIYNITGKNGKRYSFQVDIIKYKDWKNGKINLLKQSISPIEKNDVIQITTTFLESAFKCYGLDSESNGKESSSVDS